MAPCRQLADCHDREWRVNLGCTASDSIKVALGFLEQLRRCLADDVEARVSDLFAPHQRPGPGMVDPEASSSAIALQIASSPLEPRRAAR